MSTIQNFFMKLKFFLPILIPMLFTACSQQEESTLPIQPKSSFNDFQENQAHAPTVDVATNNPERKYGIKSGTIRFETWFKYDGKLWEETSIVYFDDYGKKERSERYLLDGSLWATHFNDGTYLYSLNPEEKYAYRHETTHLGTETRVSWADIPASQKASGWVEKAPNETIAGKSCEVYYVTIDGGHEKLAGWENICLLYEMVGSGYGDTSRRAVSIQEGPVDPNLFVLPSDYRVLTD